MFGQTHAALGWVVGTLAPGSDRRLRAWCTAAAVLPDVDALAMLAGKEYYDRFHHTFGHNVFTGALCVAAAAWHFRGRWTSTSLVAACFASHLLTDMKLSGWELHLLWPFSMRGWEFHPNLQLGHPINFVLVYAFMILPWLLAFRRRVTPLELVSPRLDRLLLNAFRRRDLACAACGRPCNNRCDACESPLCMRHARVDLRFRLACAGGAQGVDALRSAASCRSADQKK